MTIQDAPRALAHDPVLRPDASLDRARRLLAAYRTPDVEQAALRDEILAFLDQHPENAHRRSCLEGHLTGSALVADRSLGRVLLLHHRKLEKWLQPGGHCDGDANLPGVALREAGEETGLDGLEVVLEIFDVDIHPIPARPGEPAHRHLDTRYLVLAPDGAEPVRNEESHELRWFTPEEALRVADDSLGRLVHRLEDLRRSHGEITW